MANCYHHSLSSVKKWGGKPEDYQAIHDWFDESKKIMADFRHRALRHHAEGCFACEKESHFKGLVKGIDKLDEIGMTIK